jgi:catechol-2,3-dioxygenase
VTAGAVFARCAYAALAAAAAEYREAGTYHFTENLPSHADLDRLLVKSAG